MESTRRPVGPGGGQLEQSSIARQASRGRRPVEVAGAIEDHSTFRKGPIMADTGECMEKAFRPLAVEKRQLENYSLARRAAPRRGPIESACMIKNRSCAGVGPVAASLK